VDQQLHTEPTEPVGDERADRPAPDQADRRSRELTWRVGPRPVPPAAAHVAIELGVALTRREPPPPGARHRHRSQLRVRPVTDVGRGPRRTFSFVQVPSSHPGNVSDPSSEFAGRRGSERCTSGTADWFEFFSETPKPLSFFWPSGQMPRAGCPDRTGGLMITRRPNSGQAVPDDVAPSALRRHFAVAPFSVCHLVPGDPDAFVDTPWTLGPTRPPGARPRLRTVVIEHAPCAISPELLGSGSTRRPSLSGGSRTPSSRRSRMLLVGICGGSGSVDRSRLCDCRWKGVREDSRNRLTEVGVSGAAFCPLATVR
jgi:hypothetical protein